MAEEVEMTPVEMTPVAEEPPKANPLSKPTVPGGTVKLAPAMRKPPLPGATASALKPGLKLPPKPGATVSALRPGLKLPPKPGATVSALKPGLNLPPKPGAAGATASALKPGLKLPPKPVIRKPGSTVSAAPIPKPIAPIPKPIAPVDAQGVGKLPTVEAKSLPREEAAAGSAPVAPAEKPMATLKSVTQKLKGITQQIPQQAILRKTGIIADGAVTEAQKEAAKHKTARISLSDAMGVAPVKDEHAPMKTIRIKRPVNISGATSTATLATMAPLPSPAAKAPAAAPAEAPAPAEDDSAVSVTQRKTLKISRPGGAVRPTGKFGIRRPAGAAAPAAHTPPPAAAKSDEDAPTIATVAAPEGAVADIPDIPSMVPPLPEKTSAADSTPGWLLTLSSIVQAAAVVAIGALAFFLYENTTTSYF